MSDMQPQRSACRSASRGILSAANMTACESCRRCYRNSRGRRPTQHGDGLNNFVSLCRLGPSVRVLARIPLRVQHSYPWVMRYSRGKTGPAVQSYDWGTPAQPAANGATVAAAAIFFPVLRSTEPCEGQTLARCRCFHIKA
jgi:hypothetical protein